MPKHSTKSPALKAYEEDKARQREHGTDGDLDAGIEGSFPASDPISMTHTTVPAGRVDPDAAQRVKSSPDPLCNNPILFRTRSLSQGTSGLW